MTHSRWGFGGSGSRAWRAGRRANAPRATAEPSETLSTRETSLAMAPRASKLNAHPDPEDAHASFDQELLVATLRPDREGEYRGEIEVYDGCASAVTAYFEVTVVWDETCVSSPSPVCQ